MNIEGNIDQYMWHVLFLLSCLSSILGIGLIYAISLYKSETNKTREAIILLTKWQEHANDMNDVYDLIYKLQDLGIWMSGCEYDFTQHEYWMKNKHLLTAIPDKNESE